MPPRGKASRYTIRVQFKAPMSFVYRWCTDYSAEDPRLEKEHFTRRVLRRTHREVVYEDLYDNDREGWTWSRSVVTLHPPNRWRARAVGNYREWTLDYRLRKLSEDRTELVWTGVRRPVLLGDRNPTQAAMAREMRTMWTNFRRSLERDWRRRRRS